jgi:hypothetical protein
LLGEAPDIAITGFRDDLFPHAESVTETAWPVSHIRCGGFGADVGAPAQNPTIAELRTPEGATTTRPVSVSNGRATFVVPSLRVDTIATLR